MSPSTTRSINNFVPCIDDKRVLLQEHFLYESDMLLGTIHSFRCKLISDESIATEIVLLHGRVLRGFFLNDSPPKNTDAIAQHLMKLDESGETAVRWKNLRGPEPSLLKKIKEKADKGLAHLTYCRKRNSDPYDPWNLNEIETEFARLIAIFLDNISDEYRTEEVNLYQGHVKRISAHTGVTGTVLSSTSKRESYPKGD